MCKFNRTLYLWTQSPRQSGERPPPWICCKGSTRASSPPGTSGSASGSPPGISAWTCAPVCVSAPRCTRRAPCSVLEGVLWHQWMSLFWNCFKCFMWRWWGRRGREAVTANHWVWCQREAKCLCFFCLGSQSVQDGKFEYRRASLALLL